VQLVCCFRVTTEMAGCWFVVSQTAQLVLRGLACLWTVHWQRPTLTHRHTHRLTGLNCVLTCMFDVLFLLFSLDLEHYRAGLTDAVALS